MGELLYISRLLTVGGLQILLYACTRVWLGNDSMQLLLEVSVTMASVQAYVVCARKAPWQLLLATVATANY